MADRAYIGDGVYASTSNGMIQLDVDYGEGPQKTIYLELEVYEELVQYAHKVWPHLAPKNT